MTQVALIDPEVAGALLEARAPGQFAQRLLETAHAIGGVEELFAFRVTAAGSEEGPPEVLASLGGQADAEGRAEAYARRFHRSDPAVAVRRAARPGSGFACRVAAETIARGEYRRLCFERPRLAEKICFGWRRPEEALVVNFYRSRSHDGADAAEVARLGALAQLAITALARRDRPPRALLPEIEARLAAAHPGLTPREREVCARTLAGQTARTIAEALGLGTGTVLTYRQRAYARIGCNKSNDLLGALLG